MVRVLIVFCLFSLHCALRSDSIDPEIKPNIILFYADDLGWMDLGIQGSPYYETPNIDRLASQGIRFTNAYANAANCAPSRACLITGKYPPRHGIYTVNNPDRGKTTKRKLIPTPNILTLDTSLLTLPAYLQGAGYSTCMAGKWHLSTDPKDYGFDQNFGGFQAGHPHSYFSPYKNPFLTDGPDGEHLTDRLAGDVSQWILKNHNSPFFVYFPFYSVHTPIQPKEDLMNKYESKRKGVYHNKPAYAAMIEAMDAGVGKVLEALEETGQAENTIIIFSSDNGAHGGQTLSRPLRGSKGMYYEGGIRVPFIIKWPGKIEPGQVNHTPIIGSDLFPSIASIIPVSNSKKASWDGINILPLTQHKQIQSRSLYWHFPAYLQAYPTDRALQDSHDAPWFRSTPVGVIRKDNWKLLHYFENNEYELYNLDQDPGELNNLTITNPAMKEALSAELKAWQKKVKAPIPNTLNPNYLED